MSTKQLVKLISCCLQKFRKRIQLFLAVFGTQKGRKLVVIYFLYVFRSGPLTRQNWNK